MSATTVITSRATAMSTQSFKEKNLTFQPNLANGPGEDQSLYPAVDESTLNDIYVYGSLSHVAYFSSKTWANTSLAFYNRLGNLQDRVKDIIFLADTDDRIVDTECYAALLNDGELVLGFRGTEVIPGTGTWKDWVTDLMFFQEPVSNLFGNGDDRSGGMIHRGFLHAFNGVADKELSPPAPETQGPQSINELIDELKKNNPQVEIKRITCVGHSLGGALATLAAYWYKKVGQLKVPVSCFTFGSPRVGSPAFATEFHKIMDKAVRVVHRNDVVPTLPPQFVGYTHVGEPILLCTPANNSFRLGLGTHFKPRQYIAAAYQRPALSFLPSIWDHFIWNYVIAIGSAISKQPGPVAVYQFFDKFSGWFNACVHLQMFMMQRCMRLDPAALEQESKGGVAKLAQSIFNPLLTVKKSI